MNIQGIDRIFTDRSYCYKIIDLGCRTGDFMDILRSKRFTNTYSVGVDPLDYNVAWKYNHYLKMAIDHEVDTAKPFYVYEEKGCSSLLEMDTEIVTHNINEQKDKWYVAWDIEKTLEMLWTPTQTLSYVIENYFKDTEIDFIKCDVQGKDIDAIKSAGESLFKVKYIQLEVPSRELVLYKDQLNYDKSLEIMDSLGFVFFDKEDHGLKCINGIQSSPEADVIFVNKNL
jgi:hypothetical protein